jgi:hypothetical protein
MGYEAAFWATSGQSGAGPPHSKEIRHERRHSLNNL